MAKKAAPKEVAVTNPADATWTRLEEMLRIGIEHNRPLMRAVYLNLAFLEGYQWVHIDVSGEIVPISTNQVTEFENKIREIYLWREGYTFKNRPVPVLHGGGIDIGDMEAANVGSKLSDYWRFTCNGEAAAKEAWAWMQIAGISWTSPVFVVDLFAKVKRTRQEFSEEPLEVTGPGGDQRTTYLKDVEYDEAASEVDYHVYTPMNTYCFPMTARKWRDVEQVLHADIVTKHWVEEHLGQEIIKKKIPWSKITPIQADDLNVQLIEKVNRFVAPGFHLMQDQDSTVDRYLFLRSREVPSREHKNGRYMIYVGGQKVYSGDLPHVKWAREIDPTNNLNLTMGLVQHRAPGSPARLIPASPIGALIQAQVRYNRLLTDICRNRQISVTKIFVEANTIDKDAYTNEYGEIIELAHGADKPTVVPGQGLPNAEMELEMHRQSFEAESGRTGAMSGRNPPQVRSAQHLDIIVEEGQVIQIPAMREVEKTSEQLWWLTAAMARDKYTTEKIFAIYGEGGQGEAMQFLKANLRRDLRISEGSALPRNKAVQEALIVEAFRYGAFVNPDTGKNDTDSFWEMQRLGKMHPHIDYRRQVMFVAKGESLQMMYGEIIEPLEGEDDALHEEAHRQFEARPEYRRASEQAKMMHQWHRGIHQERLAMLSPEYALQEASEAMGTGGQAPGGVLAAPGAGAPGVPEAAGF